MNVQRLKTVIAMPNDQTLMTNPIFATDKVCLEIGTAERFQM
jgi:hypothetical protein